MSESDKAETHETLADLAQDMRRRMDERARAALTGPDIKDPGDWGWLKREAGRAWDEVVAEHGPPRAPQGATVATTSESDEWEAALLEASIPVTSETLAAFNEGMTHEARRAASALPSSCGPASSDEG